MYDAVNDSRTRPQHLEQALHARPDLDQLVHLREQ